MKRTLIYGTATAAVALAAVAGVGLAGCNRRDPSIEAVYGPPPMNESEEVIEDVYGPPVDFDEPYGSGSDEIDPQALQAMYGVPMLSDEASASMRMGTTDGTTSGSADSAQ